MEENNKRSVWLRLWDKLSLHGRVSDDFVTARTSALFNQLTMMTIIYVLSYVLVFSLYHLLSEQGLPGFRWYATALLGYGAVAAATIALNWRKFRASVSLITAFAVMAMLLNVSILYSNRSGAHFYLLLIGPLSFLMLPRGGHWLLAIIVPVSMAAFLSVHYYLTAEHALYHPPEWFMILFFSSNAIGTMVFLFIILFLYHADIEHAQTLLDQENARSEGLLKNILPETIASELKTKAHVIAEQYDEVTVLFADIVGFTEYTRRLDPQSLLGYLNTVFSSFDAIVEKHGLEKIKTVGDAYMLVGGLPRPMPDHAVVVARAALAMQEVARRMNEGNSHPLSLRIGMHSGPVVAGVIGEKKFAYDVWGETVNIASRLEMHGAADRIQLSDTTKKLLNGLFDFEDRGFVSLKGQGGMQTWFLERELGSDKPARAGPS